MMEYRNIIDKIWLFSKYYANLLFTSVKLREEDESYAALLVLFNAMELIFKAIRQNDSHNLIDDVIWLKGKGYISESDKSFINDENCGLRKIRNLMTHHDAYEYFFEINGIAYSMADQETWNCIFDSYTPQLLQILLGAVTKSNFADD